MGCGQEFGLYSECKRKSLAGLKEWSYLIFTLKDCSSYLRTSEEAKLRPLKGWEQSQEENRPNALRILQVESAECPGGTNVAPGVGGKERHQA